LIDPHAREALVRNDVRVRIAHTRGHLLTDETVGGLIGKRRYLAVQRRNVDVLAQSGHVPVLKSRKDSRRRIQAGHDADQRHTDFHRSTTR
jgi:hypothetical protein